MANVFRTTRRVEFRDTDAAGIAHFSVFFNYMEEAEHELLRSLGTSVLAKEDGLAVSWPRVAVKCEYQSAVRFEDELDIEVRVARRGAKSVTYTFRFLYAGRDVAAGEITAVYCRLPPGKPPESIPIPAGLAERLDQYAG